MQLGNRVVTLALALTMPVSAIAQQTAPTDRTAPAARPAPATRPALPPRPERPQRPERPRPPAIERPLPERPVVKPRPPSGPARPPIATLPSRPPVYPPRPPVVVIPPRPPVYPRPPIILPPPGGSGWQNNRPGGSGYWGGNGFAGHRDCSSRNGRYERCGVYTDNRVVLARQYSSQSCIRGRSWGFTRSHIWVDNGCRARFAYGYGRYGFDNSGSDAGVIIGGTIIAAGLIAILAANNRPVERLQDRTAELVADTSAIPSPEREVANYCLSEAARQVGQTGGSRLRLDNVSRIAPERDGWTMTAYASITYDRSVKPVELLCRTGPQGITSLDFR
ncbi:DUF3011 domain-containing protein [Sandaracinobacteroides saxicola]|uniref:DUF3011 domain-containing protein n=1 Tax=Sandaracinobacteroides saxicola TaxID=2759707 RepID=A0A7G5IFJ0_9SPHN|nr:DUF3011 domain-containing protein [Sandaracinobacteroides saxicola]QMW22132.1 DUF3011 domain-containing protein [Sandaracinobacteroides saxicola]